MTETGQNRENATTAALTAVTSELLREQKRRRRWGLVFRTFIAGYLLLAAGQYIYRQYPLGPSPHTALLQVSGMIGPGADIEADPVIEGLQAAFTGPDVKGVILRINSPGGSAVQAARIYDEVMRLRELYPDIPVHAVIDEVCASGGYYIAAAEEWIHANPGSLVGSIGVLMDGFGFVGALEKLGVERRLITAGKYKGMLDPFSPMLEEEREHAESLVKSVHQRFIDAVSTGRGRRLKDDKTIFSGLFWTGDQAKELGLIDSFGDSASVARDIIGAEDLVDYTVPRGWIEQLMHVLGYTPNFAGTHFDWGIWLR